MSVSNWKDCRRILCIRPDNMGDLLMSGPAIRALKTTFNCHITVLVSSMGAGIVDFMPEIDDTIIFDSPWVQTSATPVPDSFNKMVARLRRGNFDAAVIFTVYSQNPMPSVMLAYVAGIPRRLAYCRENPYHLLTDWVPDEEPYNIIKHQVRRDLDLVANVGAVATQEQLYVRIKKDRRTGVLKRLEQAGVDPEKPFMVLHTDVSELKRKYPVKAWISAGRKIAATYNCQLLITGKNNIAECRDITEGIGEGAFSLGGLLDLEEFILLIKYSVMVISVNTVTVHLAAAVQTPVLVLYAMTNPQHTPWMVNNGVLYFDVPASLQSRNEVVKYVYRSLSGSDLPLASPANILEEVGALLPQSSGRFKKPQPMS